MNAVDILFAVLLAYASVRGWQRGLLGTAAAWIAPVVAFLLAADWSDPVRAWLAASMPAPDFALDLLAPFLVFVVVVASVRTAAAVLARLLGVGLSLPSRALAAAAGALVTAVVLGSVVILVRQVRPTQPEKADDAGELIASPFENAIVNLDRRFAESTLGPPMAGLASAVVSEALIQQEKGNLPSRDQIEEATRKAAEAAASHLGQLPVPAPAADEGAKDAGRAAPSGASQPALQHGGAK